MTDLIIIGGGPAGCSAALTARRRGLSVLLLYAGDGALGWAGRVDNYPGMPGISGREMLDAFRRQTETSGAELRRALAQNVMETQDGFSVLAENDVLQSRALILATGVSRAAELENEDALVGSGVSYCATCDGMFFRGKSVAVVASDAGALHETEFLSTLCDVSYFKEKPHTAALPANVREMPGKPAALAREGGKIIVKTKDGAYAYDGVFILRPAVALRRLLPGLEMDKSAVRTDKSLAASVNGVFAAGDLIGEPYQIAKAVGDGCMAALSADRYIRSKR